MQAMPMDDDLNLREARKGANPAFLVSRVHVVAKDYILETNVQPKMQYATGATEKDILCHAA